MRRLQDIAFKPFPSYERLVGIFKKPNFKARRAEEDRKLNLAQQLQTEEEEENDD